MSGDPPVEERLQPFGALGRVLHLPEVVPEIGETPAVGGRLGLCRRAVHGHLQDEEGTVFRIVPPGRLRIDQAHLTARERPGGAQIEAIHRSDRIEMVARAGREQTIAPRERSRGPRTGRPRSARRGRVAVRGIGIGAGGVRIGHVERPPEQLVRCRHRISREDEDLTEDPFERERGEGGGVGLDQGGTSRIDGRDGPLRRLGERVGRLDRDARRAGLLPAPREGGERGQVGDEESTGAQSCVHESLRADAPMRNASHAPIEFRGAHRRVPGRRARARALPDGRAVKKCTDAAALSPAGSSAPAPARSAGSR